MDDLYIRLKSYEPFWWNWEIDAYLGKGATSTVYRLKQKGLDGNIKYSALKIISVTMNSYYSNASSRPDILEEKIEIAKREILNMQKFNDCPYIVHCKNYAIKEIFDNNKEKIGYDILIQMDYYQCFSHHIAKMTVPMEENEVLKLAIQIGTGLKAAHDINMMHRDIKPANFFIDKQGNYLLGDLGVSKQWSDNTSCETITGTQPYIAPEIYKHQKYDETVDIYSLGIVLYQLLNNNSMPFTNINSSMNDIQNAIDKRLNGGRFEPPINGSLELKRIVMKACSYNSADRYQSIDEFLNDLYKLMREKNKKEDNKSFESSQSEDLKVSSEHENIVDKYKTISANDDELNFCNDSNDEIIHNEVVHSDSKPHNERKNNKIIIPLCCFIALLLIATIVFVVSSHNKKDDYSTNNTSNDSDEFGWYTDSESNRDDNDALLSSARDFWEEEGDYESSEDSLSSDSELLVSQDESNTTSTDNSAAQSAVEKEVSKQATVDHTVLISEQGNIVYYEVYTTDGHIYWSSYNKSTGSVNITKF